MAVRRPRHYRFSTQNPAIFLDVLRGENPPQIQGGYGQYEIVDRPHRMSLTRWTGRQPFRLVVPILFDGWEDQESQEGDIDKLEQMALPTSPGGEPPVVTINGAVPWKDLPWVIETIDWGDAIYARRNPIQRYRQYATITFLRKVKEDVAAAKVFRDKGKGYRTYVVKRGDTLRKIAAHQLGDSARWREIARINKIRDPRSIRPGQRLRIPKQ